MVAEVAAAHEPFVVLLDDDAGGEPDQRASLGKMPSPSVRRPISRLTRSSGLVDRNDKLFASILTTRPDYPLDEYGSRGESLTSIPRSLESP